MQDKLEDLKRETAEWDALVEEEWEKISIRCEMEEGEL